MPPEYIREREVRACEYAQKNGKSVTELLIEWYSRDNAQQKQGFRAGARDAPVMRSGAELDAYFEQRVKERWG